MSTPKTRERTRRFQREQRIDCSNWQTFEFLTASYRDITLRIVEFDTEAPKEVESETHAGERPAQN